MDDLVKINNNAIHKTINFIVEIVFKSLFFIYLKLAQFSQNPQLFNRFGVHNFNQRKET